MSINLKKQAGIALVYFFVISLLGVVLRFLFITPIKEFNFSYFLHAHSHVALLGWFYLGLMVLLYKAFLQNENNQKTYKWIFFFTNLSVLGMLLSFPFQGYAFLSIAFSTLYLLSSYWFVFFSIRNIPKKLKKRKSWIVFKTALFYLLISSIGTWAIGPISATVGLSSFWFKDALYFFLHFLYSGFFFSSLIGVLLYVIENKGEKISRNKFNYFYSFLNIGIVLSYFLSVLWTKPNAIFYLLGGIGALYQLLGFYLLYQLIKPNFKFLKKEFNAFSQSTLKISLYLLGLRVLMQLLSAIPYFAVLVFKLRDFIIGYLHLVFLGVITPLLLLFLSYFKLIKLSRKTMHFFMLIVILSEGLIFYRAFSLWWGLPLLEMKLFNQVLAFVSILFPIAIFLLLWPNFLSKKEPNTGS